MACIPTNNYVFIIKLIKKIYKSTHPSVGKKKRKKKRLHYKYKYINDKYEVCSKHKIIIVL